MSLINLNQINVIDSVSITPDGSVPIAVQFGDNLWSGNYKKGMLVPKGDTSERFATPDDGYLRYNTDLAEFEGFTNSDWRPTGQLTIDGDNTDPSRSFVSDPTTGSYLISAGNYGITAGGSVAIQISVTDTTIKNDLIVEDSIFAGSGINDMETTATQVTSLLANQTDTVIAAPLTYDGTTYQAVIVDYLVQRDVGSAVGILYIVNDGTDVSITDTSVSVNNTDITFTATITTGTVEVKYTSTVGNDATMKYVVRRWGI